MSNVKFIEDDGSTKVREISFKENIDNPTIITTIATDNRMMTFPYTIGDA